MQDLVVFDGSKNVRISEKDGKLVFVVVDVVPILGYASASLAVRILDEDEKGVHDVYTPGGIQSMLVVTESGLYHLIFKSRKPAAKKFRKWVTEEVIPSIRKTGSYLDPKQIAAKTVGLDNKAAWHQISETLRIRDIWAERKRFLYEQRLLEKFRKRGDLTDDQVTARVHRILFATREVV